MIDLTRLFELTYNRQTLSVTPRKAGKDYVFIIRFASNTPPLVLARALGENRGHFWTSIPEGRQQEAERIGPLITQHYQQLQKLETQGAVQQAIF